MTCKGFIGFYNNGNSCYFNTALQALLSCNEFCECIEASLYKEQGTLRFMDIFNEIIQNKHNPKIYVYNPILLRRVLSHQNSYFKSPQQQDCHECLIKIIDILHEFLKDDTSHSQNIMGDNKRILNKGDGIKADKEWSNSLNQVSFMNTLFSGQLKSTLECTSCESKRDTFELFNQLSLTLPQTNKNEIDIIECFNYYFRTETLYDIECNKCKNRTLTLKKLSVWRFPRILILHLNRYIGYGNTNPKNNSVVDFSPYLIFKNNGNSLTYTLKCIVNHHGNNPNNGHYNCIVSSDKHEWLYIDDSSISKYPKESIVSNKVYMLIYVLGKKRI